MRLQTLIDVLTELAQGAGGKNANRQVNIELIDPIDDDQIITFDLASIGPASEFDGATIIIKTIYLSVRHDQSR